MLGYFALVVVVAASVLAWAHAQPHAAASADEEGSSSVAGPQLTPQQATQNFPASDIAQLRTIAHDTLSMLQTADQAGATTKVDDLEQTWDADQPTLEGRDQTAWHFLDGEIDAVLSAVRAQTPDSATEQNVLRTLLQSLG